MKAAKAGMIIVALVTGLCCMTMPTNASAACSDEKEASANFLLSCPDNSDLELQMGMSRSQIAMFCQCVEKHFNLTDSANKNCMFDYEAVQGFWLSKSILKRCDPRKN